MIEDDSVATAICAFMAGRDSWSGTAAGLLIELNNRDRSEAQPSKSRRTPSAFAKDLRKVAAALRESGS